MDVPEWAKGLAVLVAGVALSGLANFALTEAGYSGLGTLVWVLGYLGTLMVIWMEWVRHVDFGGATG